MPFPQDAISSDAVLADVGARTIDLAAAAHRFTEDEVRRPSALPGWTRGHALAHLADNADAFVGALLRAADSDDAGLTYPSSELRDAKIEAGAGLTVDGHLQRLLNSAQRLAIAWRDLSADRLAVPLSGTAGWTRPVADIPWMRWRELALHAVDLGLHPQFSSGDPLVARLLDEAAQGWAGRSDPPSMVLVDTERDPRWQVGDGAVRIEGTTADLALWLTGRSDGSTLSASGPLPVLPPWL